MIKNKRVVFLVVTIIVCSVIIAAAASFDNEQSIEKINFVDVGKSDWFYDDVNFVFGNRLMTGTGENEFSPYLTTTRGMIVTILWRLENQPVLSTKCAFSDVDSDMYYYNAVKWAAKANIISGYDDKYFGPEDDISREQLAAILHRYATHKKIDTSKLNENITTYIDFKDIDTYAVEAFKWATENGIVTGVSDKELDPNGNASRCQVAAMLKRICEKFNILSYDVSDKKDDSTDDGTVTENNTSSLPKNDETIGGIIGGGLFSEEQRANITVNTAYGMPGNIVEVTLNLNNNPGILGMILSLECDENAMNLIGVENGDAVSDVLTLTPSNTLNSGVRFVWDGLDLTPSDIKDGVLLTLKFEIFDDVTIGKRYPLKFSYDSGNIVDKDLKEVNPRIYQGYIEIEQSNTN